MSTSVEDTGQERLVVESIDDLTTILKAVLDQDHIPTTGYAARKAREMWKIFARSPDVREPAEQIRERMQDPGNHERYNAGLRFALSCLQPTEER